MKIIGLWVGRNFEGNLIQPLVSVQECFSWIIPQQCLSSLLWKTSSEGGSRTPLGSLFHCLALLTTGSFSWHPINRQCCTLKPLLHVLPSTAREHIRSPSLTDFQIFENLLFPRLTFFSKMSWPFNCVNFWLSLPILRPAKKIAPLTFP